jgi:hypothetical protein
MFKKKRKEAPDFPFKIPRNFVPEPFPEYGFEERIQFRNLSFRNCFKQGLFQISAPGIGKTGYTA